MEAQKQLFRDFRNDPKKLDRVRSREQIELPVPLVDRQKQLLLGEAIPS
jgi:hypothetical protein